MSPQSLSCRILEMHPVSLPLNDHSSCLKRVIDTTMATCKRTPLDRSFRRRDCIYFMVWCDGMRMECTDAAEQCKRYKCERREGVHLV